MSDKFSRREFAAHAFTYIFRDCAFHLDHFAIDFMLLVQENILRLLSIAEHHKPKATRAL